MIRRRTKRTTKPTGTPCLFIRAKCGNYVACDAIQTVKARLVDQNVGQHYNIMAVGVQIVEHLIALDKRDVPHDARFDLEDLADRIAEHVALASRAKSYPVDIACIEDIANQARRELCRETCDREIPVEGGIYG